MFVLVLHCLPACLQVFFGATPEEGLRFLVVLIHIDPGNTDRFDGLTGSLSDIVRLVVRLRNLLVHLEDNTSSYQGVTYTVKPKAAYLEEQGLLVLQDEESYMSALVRWVPG